MVFLVCVMCVAARAVEMTSWVPVKLTALCVQNARPSMDTGKMRRVRASPQNYRYRPDPVHPSSASIRRPAAAAPQHLAYHPASFLTSAIRLFGCILPSLVGQTTV